MFVYKWVIKEVKSKHSAFGQSAVTARDGLSERGRPRAGAPSASVTEKSYTEHSCKKHRK